MSNTNRLNDSITDNKTREVVVILQIPKTMIVDKNTTIGDLKRMSKQHFSKYSDDFNLFIKDFDISTLENMNAIRTFDYYKSNSLILNPKNLKKNLNDSNIFLSRDVNTDAETSQIFLDSKEKTNEIYQNIDNLQKRVDDFKKKSSKDYLKVNQFGSPEEIINRSYAYIKSNQNQREIDFPETHSHLNFDHRNQWESRAFSPQRPQNMSKLFEKSEEIINRSLKKDVYSQSNQNLNRNKSEIPKERNVSNIPLTDRMKQFNQNLSPINSYNDSLLNENILNSKTNEYNVPKEDFDNVYMTNKILNKSNMELKARIKELENDIEAGKEYRIKLQEMSRIMDNMGKNMSAYENKLKEANEIIENLQKSNNELSLENKKFRNELEGITGNIEFIDKTNYELKLQIESLEEINSKSDNEKNFLSQHLNEKDKIISELNEKIRCLNEVNANTKKSCRDYEDMLNGMKRTIDIMKKSTDDGDSEVKRLKISLNDLHNTLEKKNDEYTNLEKIKVSLVNEMELLKNEISYLTNENSAKEKIINENNCTIRSNQIDLEKYKMKVESMNKIIDEKDKTIENMKHSVATLNRNLEDYKYEFDNMKKLLNDEMVEKSKLTRNKEQFDFSFTEYKKQIDDLTKLKDNLYKQNFALEEDNSELRSKFFAMRNENDNLNLKISFLNETIKELNNEINNINNSKNVVDHEKVNMNMKITELMNKLNQAYNVEVSLKNEIENLSSKLASKDKSIENLLKSKDEVNQELFTTREKMKAVYNEKNKILEELDIKINEIKFVESKAKREHERYNNDMKAKENYIENLNKSLEDFKLKLHEFNTQKEKEVYVLEKTIEDLKKNLSESREKENSLMIEKEESLNDAKYKDKFIKNLENTINELNENLLNYKRNYEKINHSNREFLEQVDELKIRNEELNQKIVTMMHQYEKLSETCSDLKLGNQDLYNKNNILQKELTNAKMVNEKLDVENKKLSQIENLKNIIVNNSNYGSNDKNTSPSKNNRYVKFENPLYDSNNFETNVNPQKNVDITFKENRNTLEQSQQSLQGLKRSLNEFSFEKNKYMTSEINVKTSEVNSKLERKKSVKIDILEGSKIIFAIFDNKRILRFDLENRIFKLIEFADFGDFEGKFCPQGSIYLNILEGLLIVTGENHDQFFHYSHTKHAMNKLAKLNNNHSYGSMVYYDEGNSVICLSGWHNKRVEKYVNDEIITSYLKKLKNYNRKPEKQIKNTWAQMPELTVERSEASFAIFDKYLYAFFGFNCPQMKYLDSIERLNMESPLMWELVTYRNERHISAFKKSHACIPLNDSEVLFIGGYDGLNDCPIESFSFYNVKKNEYYSTDRKFPDITKNHIYNFQKNNSAVPYIDINNRLHLVAVDEKDVVHVVEAKTLQYDLFVSFD